MEHGENIRREEFTMSKNMLYNRDTAAVPCNLERQKSGIYSEVGSKRIVTNSSKLMMIGCIVFSFIGLFLIAVTALVLSATLTIQRNENFPQPETQNQIEGDDQDSQGDNTVYIIFDTSY